MLLVGILLVIILISLSINEERKERLYKPIYLYIKDKKIILQSESAYNKEGKNQEKKDLDIKVQKDFPKLYILNELPKNINVDSLTLKTEEKKTKGIKLLDEYRLLDLLTQPNYSLESLRSIILVLVLSVTIVIGGLITIIQVLGINNDNMLIFNDILKINEQNQILEIILYIFAIMILYSFNSIDFNRFNFIFEKVSSLVTLERQLNIKPIDSIGLLGLFSLLGGLLLINSNNLILIFISIEIQSYSLYALSSIYKESYSSTDSGLKYFLLGGLASVFILFGSGLLYVASSSISLEDLYKLINLGYYNNIIVGGSIFLILGFLLKAASAPMHTWSPDVYDGVPTIITTWLSVLTKISILAFIYQYIASIASITKNTNYYRITEGFFNNSSLASLDINLIFYIILICAILSMMIGAISGLKENKIKRLFAYSGVTNIGYLLLSLTNTEYFGSFVFYLIQYSISNLNLFLIIIVLGYALSTPKNSINVNYWKEGFNKYSPIRYVSQLSGIFYSYPYLAISLAITLFSLVGIPPLIGFYAKYFIIVDTIKSQSYFIVFILILASVISSFYYLRIIKILFETNTSSDLTIFNTLNININNNSNSNKNSNDNNTSNFNNQFEYYSSDQLLIDKYIFSDPYFNIDNHGDLSFNNSNKTFEVDHFDNSFYNQYILPENVKSIKKNINYSDNFNIFKSESNSGLYIFDPICLIIAFNTSLLIFFFMFSTPILEFFNLI
jgi:NADH-ubiquinone oxidoreductase chain 2